MSRQDHLTRLSDWHIRTKDPSYIHYYFLIRDIKEAIEKYARGSFLDLGCGNKPYESLYNPKTERQTGCDVQQSDGNRVDVICPATELKFESNQFDSILCTQVLEHVYDHHTMMKEIFRVLKPGGHILLTVPFVWELHEEPYDFFRFTPHSLRELFTEAGLAIDYIKPNGGKWAAIYQLRNNALYDSFRRNKSLLSKLKKMLFIDLRLTQLRNHYAIWLDKTYPSEVLTLNYIVVAHKPS
ncbi:MAG: methyltransferase domain-containing protein [Cyclobacteriaceae bacterium]|nr:methyltransferase domain-containing protein [Cyclobacteriaceae bacterium]